MAHICGCTLLAVSAAVREAASNGLGNSSVSYPPSFRRRVSLTSQAKDRIDRSSGLRASPRFALHLPTTRLASEHAAKRGLRDPDFHGDHPFFDQAHIHGQFPRTPHPEAISGRQILPAGISPDICARDHAGCKQTPHPVCNWRASTYRSSESLLCCVVLQTTLPFYPPAPHYTFRIAPEMSMHQLPRRDVVHLADVQTRSQVFTVWERYRHRQAHWLVECAAETVSDRLNATEDYFSNTTWV